MQPVSKSVRHCRILGFWSSLLIESCGLQIGTAEIVPSAETSRYVIYAYDSFDNLAEIDTGMVVSLLISNPDDPGGTTGTPARPNDDGQCPSYPCEVLGIWDETEGGYVLAYQIDSAGSYNMDLSVYTENSVQPETHRWISTVEAGEVCAELGDNVTHPFRNLIWDFQHHLPQDATAGILVAFWLHSV